MAVLDAQSISIVFGGLKAVTNFDFKIEKGELVGLIGPNGAGKTTIFNMLTGVYTPTEGNILLNQSEETENYKKINDLKPYQITQMGIGRTFQNIRLFKDMTVIDNVKTAFHFNAKYNAIQAVLRTPAFFREEEAITEKARELLKIFNIQDKENELAKNLPYGEQRELEITRALATNPKLLLLDEPAAGMNPQETQGLMKLIRFIRDKFKITILLIEHDMNLVMGICERIVVLDYGQIIAKGTPAEISKDPKVIKAYLGEEADLGA
jgi:branched-chain amino acid transport system ATP-binding protein